MPIPWSRLHDSGLHAPGDMKARYGGEVFPDVYIPGRGRDPLDFFQSTRAGEPKGIVVLYLEELP